MDNYLDLRNDTDYTKIRIPAEIIKNGGLVLFPTETVYGLGANGLDETAVAKIFVAKKRAQDNPLILHIADMNMLDKIAKNISITERKLMDTFWPGPFTIILEKKENVPYKVTAGLDTVAVRMPSNKIANTLIRYSGVPIAAPSANISGRPSGTNVQDIFDELYDKVDYIIDGGSSDVGLESTVVRVKDNVPIILRPGKITPSQIANIVGCVDVDEHVLNRITNEEKILSPGMKYRHYAPTSKCVLVYSIDNEKLVNRINEISSNYTNPIILSSTENKNLYSCKNIIDVGSRNNLEEIAKNIFTDLRKVDDINPDIVIIEGVPEEGLGLAIMNRLIRACEFNIINLDN